MIDDHQQESWKLDAAYQPFPTFDEWSKVTGVDGDRWRRYISTLEGNQDLDSAHLKRAREIAKRAAAIDTGALEDLYEVDRGFTFTVALESASWEAALAAKGEEVRSLFQAQLDAYEYILDLAARSERITEASIRVLHEQICRSQKTYRVITAVGPQEQPLPKGQYKTLPNHVLTRKGEAHSYAPVDVTPSEMARLVKELGAQSFIEAHPVLQAAYSHYCLVVIHPFADGNGRVARALASVFTYRAISLPIVILVEHKLSYLESLEAADRGHFQDFVDFILARSFDTIQLVNESIRAGSFPSVDESLSAISSLYITRGGYTHKQIDSAGESLIQLAHTEIQKLVQEKITLPVSSNVQIINAGYRSAEGYRAPLSQGKGLTLTIVTPVPAQAKVNRLFYLHLPRDAAGDDDIVLREAHSDDSFSARIDELTPTLSGVLQMRAKMFAERVVGEMLSQLAAAAENAYRGNG